MEQDLQKEAIEIVRELAGGTVVRQDLIHLAAALVWKMDHPPQPDPDCPKCNGEGTVYKHDSPAIGCYDSRTCKCKSYNFVKDK